jgi:hypothetical protein
MAALPNTAKTTPTNDATYTLAELRGQALALRLHGLLADLLFELVSRRYLSKSTVVTTNRPFAEWNQVFPSAACVVSLVDRLMHRAEAVRTDGESYRQKGAEERAAQRRAARSAATRSRSPAKARA